MSIVFSEKTRRTRLALRWPFSRQITLSVGTLLVLLAVWWAVAALQWVSPLFLPPPELPPERYACRPPSASARQEKTLP